MVCLHKFLETLDPLDKRCGLFFDEIALIPGHEYDPSTNEILGVSTFPGDPKQDATHGLVFMLCGLKLRWKQVIAYYFTGKLYIFKSFMKNVYRSLEFSPHFPLLQSRHLRNIFIKPQKSIFLNLLSDSS